MQRAISSDPSGVSENTFEASMYSSGEYCVACGNWILDDLSIYFLQVWELQRRTTMFHDDWRAPFLPHDGQKCLAAFEPAPVP